MTRRRQPTEADVERFKGLQRARGAVVEALERLDYQIARAMVGDPDLIILDRLGEWSHRVATARDTVSGMTTPVVRQWAGGSIKEGTGDGTHLAWRDCV